MEYLYILIITTTLDTSKYSGVLNTNLQEFTSKESCEKAGTIYINKEHIFYEDEYPENTEVLKKSYVCVKN